MPPETSDAPGTGRTTWRGGGEPLTHGRRRTGMPRTPRGAPMAQACAEEAGAALFLSRCA